MCCLAQCFLVPISVLHRTPTCTRWCRDRLLPQPASPGSGLITADPWLRCWLLQVPYSEHSSFPELKAFTHWLR